MLFFLEIITTIFVCKTCQLHVRTKKRVLGRRRKDIPLFTKNYPCCVSVIVGNVHK